MGVDLIEGEEESLSLDVPVELVRTGEPHVLPEGVGTGRERLVCLNRYLGKTDLMAEKEHRRTRHQAFDVSELLGETQGDPELLLAHLEDDVVPLGVQVPLNSVYGVGPLVCRPGRFSRPCDSPRPSNSSAGQSGGADRHRPRRSGEHQAEYYA
jgi:hypothetical protein